MSVGQVRSLKEKIKSARVDLRLIFATPLLAQAEEEGTGLKVPWGDDQDVSHVVACDSYICLLSYHGRLLFLLSFLALTLSSRC